MNCAKTTWFVKNRFYLFPAQMSDKYSKHYNELKNGNVSQQIHIISQLWFASQIKQNRNGLILWWNVGYILQIVSVHSLNEKKKVVS